MDGRITTSHRVISVVTVIPTSLVMIKMNDRYEITNDESKDLVDKERGE